MFCDQILADKFSIYAASLKIASKSKSQEHLFLPFPLGSFLLLTSFQGVLVKFQSFGLVSFLLLRAHKQGSISYCSGLWAPMSSKAGETWTKCNRSAILATTPVVAFPRKCIVWGLWFLFYFKCNMDWSLIQASSVKAFHFGLAFWVESLTSRQKSWKPHAWPFKGPGAERGIVNTT